MIQKTRFREGAKIALSSYAQALKMTFTTKIGWFLLVPLILNILLFSVGIYLYSSFTGNLSDLIIGKIGLDNVESGIMGVVNKIVSGFLWVFFQTVFLFVFLFFGGYIVLIIMSPVLSYVSEMTESRLNGKDYPFKLKQFLKDVVRGIKLALRNMLVELIWVIIVFIASFIPLAGWLGSIFLFVVSSYFYGFSFIDYYLERQKMNTRDSVLLIRDNKGLAIGNGAVFAFSLFIPWVGMMLSSFVSIISVVAATITMDKVMNKEVSVLEQDIQQHI